MRILRRVSEGPSDWPPSNSFKSRLLILRFQHRCPTTLYKIHLQGNMIHSYNGPEQGEKTPQTETQDGQKIAQKKPNLSAFKSLGFLDRFLAVWIFLAMVIGILLGNFVPQTGPSLQRGKFVGVSVPIGKLPFYHTVLVVFNR